MKVTINVLLLLILRQCRGFKILACVWILQRNVILDEIGSHFLDQAVELSRQGGEFCVVLDNIYWEIKVHNMRQKGQNVSEHAVARGVF